MTELRTQTPEKDQQLVVNPFRRYTRPSLLDELPIADAKRKLMALTAYIEGVIPITAHINQVFRGGRGGFGDISALGGALGEIGRDLDRAETQHQRALVEIRHLQEDYKQEKSSQAHQRAPIMGYTG